jgi:hypothetical protein
LPDRAIVPSALIIPATDTEANAVAYTREPEQCGQQSGRRFVGTESGTDDDRLRPLELLLDCLTCPGGDRRALPLGEDNDGRFWNEPDKHARD